MKCDIHSYDICRVVTGMPFIVFTTSGLKRKVLYGPLLGSPNFSVSKQSSSENF